MDNKYDVSTPPMIKEAKAMQHLTNTAGDHGLWSGRSFAASVMEPVPLSEHVQHGQIDLTITTPLESQIKKSPITHEPPITMNHL
jgi:hypothetical protein